VSAAESRSTDWKKWSETHLSDASLVQDLAREVFANPIHAGLGLAEHPAECLHSAENTEAEADVELVFGDLSDLVKRPIVFADKPLLQADAFHVLAGRKGVGKGTWLAHVAARVTLGELGEKRRVIWIALGEDSYEIDILPRIVAGGGDPKLVKYLERGRLLLPDSIPALLKYARGLGDVGLIVIDPLGGGFSGDRSSNLDSDVRPAIAPLNQLADLLACMVIGVRHITNKEVRGGSLAGILGSSDWGNVPRAVLALVRDDGDEGIRHIQVVAGNRVPSAAGRSFRIIGKPVVDGGEPVSVAIDFGDSEKDVDDLLGNGNVRRDQLDKQALQVLILAHLETGPKSREYLNELGRDELKATPDQVYRQGIEPLRQAEKITASKDGLVGGWSYALA
jgi:AAA domain